MRRLLSIWIVSFAIGVTAAAGQSRQGRFAGMDRNQDGVITRQEWRGSTRSFQVHDWNNDGVLSGDEVRGAARRTDPAEERDYLGDDDPGDLRWTEQQFANFDHDRDGRLSAVEWHGDRETFRRADRDGDGYLNRSEFLRGDEDDDRGDRFDDLDGNRDGRVTRSEWHGGAEAFGWLDRDGDGVLTRREVVGDEARRAARPDDRFENLDVNDDNVVSRDEWHWSAASFTRVDTDRNGAITRAEWGARRQTQAATQSPGYRAGYQRGLQEGRQAGREDATIPNWDLEGQRELEQADSGWNASLGTREDYQAGYRAGFRLGYGEGFGPRR